MAFTGSATTAAILRAHPAVTERSVRFNAETDSLNASVLGPDGAPGTPEFDLHVKGLVTEMTVKAGQKCTAIRRAFVPRAYIDDVIDAVVARLEKIRPAGRFSKRPPSAPGRVATRSRRS